VSTSAERVARRAGEPDDHREPGGEPAQRAGGQRDVLGLLEESRRFTEALQEVNRQLCQALQEAGRADAPVGGSGEAARLLDRIHSLEDELSGAKCEVAAVQRELLAATVENSTFAEQFVEVERQNSQLANMYVASYRLHTTLMFDEVIEIVKEVVINLVGAEEFAVYVRDEKSDLLHLVGQESGSRNAFEAQIPMGVGFVGRLAQAGEQYVARANTPQGAVRAEPIACIPLQLDDEVVGVLVIHKLLVQKQGFVPLDLELFDLLGRHAAAAIYSARLFTQSRRKLDTLQGLLDLVRTPGA